MFYKQLQYTCCPICHKVKTTRHWNLVNLQNITREIFFLKNYAENWAGRLVLDFVFWKNKSLIWGKGKWSAYIAIALNLPYNKSKLCKTSDYWSRDILNFNFSEKGLGQASAPLFLHDFLRKMFLMLNSINWPNYIVWLPLRLQILGICVLQLFVNQAVTS